MDNKIDINLEKLLEDMKYLKGKTIKAEMLKTFSKSEFYKNSRGFILAIFIIICFGYQDFSKLISAVFLSFLVIVGAKLLKSVCIGKQKNRKLNHWISIIEKSKDLNRLPAIEVFSLQCIVNQLKKELE